MAERKHYHPCDCGSRHICSKTGDTPCAWRIFRNQILFMHSSINRHKNSVLYKIRRKAKKVENSQCLTP